jgi:hypothetical protein
MIASVAAVNGSGDMLFGDRKSGKNGKSGVGKNGKIG